MNARTTILWGTIFAFLAVALGAFGAHAWQGLLETNATEDIFETASEYHFIHALALLWLGLYRRDLSKKQDQYLTIATYLLITGTLIFSGSLYYLAISNLHWLGAITPIGGLFLLCAWLMIGLNLLKQRD